MISKKKIAKLENKMQEIGEEDGVLFCPECGSTDVVGDGARMRFNARAMICKKCGNTDLNFPESLAKPAKRGGR